MYHYLRRVEVMLILHDALDFQELLLLDLVQPGEKLALSFPNMLRVLYCASDALTHDEEV
jgi:hypothetical protein